LLIYTTFPHWTSERFALSLKSRLRMNIPKVKNDKNGDHVNHYSQIGINSKIRNDW